MTLFNRRQFIQSILSAGTTLLIPPAFSRINQPISAHAPRHSSGRLSAIPAPGHLRKIPSSGESLPSIGMGTWITFDVPDNDSVINQRASVLKAFFDHGGAMIDSSPMYGRSEAVIGRCLEQIDDKSALFAASKIWTPVTFDGVAQLANSERLWRVPSMKLMYVHNLLNWKSHLSQLREWKEAGRIRYVGVTTSHGRRHDELERVLETEALDFVQLTYNLENRASADRLIPLAQDKGIAVIVNRPYARGRLIQKYRNQPLPGLAKELGCQSWAQYLLLFAISQPGVTAAIPATTRVDHMVENMQVMTLAIPDAATYRKM